MGIVSDKSKPLLLRSYDKKKNFWAITQPFFVLEQNFRKVTPPKIGKMIGVSQVNFYSKINF